MHSAFQMIYLEGKDGVQFAVKVTKETTIDTIRKAVSRWIKEDKIKLCRDSKIILSPEQTVAELDLKHKELLTYCNE